MSQFKRRALGIATASLLALAAGQALVSTSAAASPTVSASTSRQYVTVVPVCRAPKAKHAQCFALRRVKAQSTSPGARPMAASPSYATGPAGGFTAGDLATAYGVNADTATTQVVGIVDAFDDPNAKADLNTFDSHYGLPAETSTSFRKVSQTGSTTTLPAADAGWAGEESLDLDAVRGLCHKCQIILVEANSSSFSDLATAENEAVTLGAKVLSNSYGGPESGTISAAVLAAYKHAGIVIAASTGDHGMFDWDTANSGGQSSNAPEVPSSLNTVVAVGGTSVYLNSDGTRSGETVWNENGSSNVTGGNLNQSMGATGGGCSTQVAAQGWQHSVANYSQTTCGSFRLAADVSALADPYTGYDIYDTYGAPGWQTFGGTSLASPMIAAMWAMAGGSGGVSYPSLSLYGHFKSDSTHPLYDVTTGGNGFCDGTPATACESYWGASPNTFGLGILDCAFKSGSATLSAGTRACDAATGYDGPSGVGAPTGLNAFKPLSPTAKITVPSTITHGSSANFSGSTSTDPFPGGTKSTYAWTWGDGATTTGSSASASHTYPSAGTFSLKLTVTDNYSRSGSVTVSITVH
jgi:PKD domain